LKGQINSAFWIEEETKKNIYDDNKIDVKKS